MTRISEEALKRFSNERRGEGNPNWKADKVGYIALHSWVKSRLAKPQLCQKCLVEPPYDLANVTGKYTRDLINWKYLCRRCHMSFDGRLLARGPNGKWVSPKKIRVYSPLSRRRDGATIYPNIFLSGSGLGSTSIEESQ